MVCASSDWSFHGHGILYVELWSVHSIASSKRASGMTIEKVDKIMGEPFHSYVIRRINGNEPRVGGSERQYKDGNATIIIDFDETGRVTHINVLKPQFRLPVS
jgi:hypothetical protein